MYSAKKYSIFCMALLLALSLAQAVAAQEKFPGKPVRMVITHAAGGSVDLPG